MGIEDTIALIQSVSRRGSHLGLERVEKLMSLLGNPQKDLRFIHVAGTNGKGSVSAMLSSVLTSAGYTAGLYTSPHLVSYRERMKVCGADISEDDFHSLAEDVCSTVGMMEEKVTEFEIVTAMAFLYFFRMSCDIVVLEVGLGGRLDATNVISAPEAAVLMNIGLEHTDVLGSTLEEIAREKVGIVKEGAAVIAYPGTRKVEAVFESVCGERNAALRKARFSDISFLSESLDGQQFSWRQYSNLEIRLLGRHQIFNAAMALETVEILKEKGWKIPETAVRQGLAEARWPARCEVMSRSPLFILDGAHNPQCANALADSVRLLCPGEKVVFLAGVLADKDYGGIFNSVAPLGKEFFCLTPDSERAMPAEELAMHLSEQGLTATACADIGEGIFSALSAAGDGGAVVAFGSLYLAGAVREAFPRAFKKWLRKEKIRARESFSPEEREDMSRLIVRRIIESPEFKRAKTVMIYRATRGEVCLDALMTAPEAHGKRLVYPLCAGKTELLALLPKENEWASGSFGIKEPVLNKSLVIPPEEIDMVLCPCVSFDEEGSRLGMGAGYYDRFLLRCRNAYVALVAFEAQKAAQIPRLIWDYPMELMFTEKTIYSGKEGISGLN